MFHSKTNVTRLYKSVMDDVIEAISKEGLDSGADDQMLTELRRLWYAKLMQSSALEHEQPFCLRVHHSNVQVTQFGVDANNGTFSVTAPAVTIANDGISMKHTDIPRIIMHTNMEGSLVNGSDIVPCNVAAQLLRSGEGSLNLEDFSNCAGRLARLTRKTQYKSASKRNVLDRDDDAGGRQQEAGCSGTRRVLPGQVDGSFLGPNSDMDYSSDENDSFIGDNDSHIGSPSSEGNREPQDPDEILNSGDDEEDPIGENEQLDDIDNIVVCQYAKVHRKGAHWKIRLTQGIMNIEGKDHIFSRMDGEADW